MALKRTVRPGFVQNESIQWKKVISFCFKNKYCRNAGTKEREREGEGAIKRSKVARQSVRGVTLNPEERFQEFRWGSLALPVFASI